MRYLNRRVYRREVAKSMIDSLLHDLEKVDIGYSVGFHAIAILVHKGILTNKEVVDFIKKTEEELAYRSETEMKTEEQLNQIKSLFPKEVKEIESAFVEEVNCHVINAVFVDNTYVTIKAFVDIEKLKREIERIRLG